MVALAKDIRMLNWGIMSAWENWFTVFLMIAIVLVGLHVFVDQMDRM